MLILPNPMLAAGILGGTYAAIRAFFITYRYIALFILMTLEYASFPIPSEVVLPLAGFLSSAGLLNVYVSLGVVLVAGLIGMSIDYIVAYYLGRKILYGHLHLFHINKESFHNFEVWFEANGSFAVFVARLIPIVRALISLPAGFAAMDLKRFFVYSFFGSLIWDVALLSFGYYALGANNIYIVTTSIATFAIVIYAIYYLFIKSIKRKRPHN